MVMKQTLNEDGSPAAKHSTELAMHHGNSSGESTPLNPFSNHSQWEGQATSPSLADPENVTSERPILSGPIAAMLSMTLGILSNIVALLILANAYARLRRRSKAFLLFAGSLVATDFVGHVIPGSIVMRLYLSGGVPSEEYNRADPLCQFLGGSMVFFGLCPLFLGCAMAAERCLGVTKPLLHASLVTTARTKLSLSVIWLAALCVALLPCFQLGSYTYQYPGTWCFIKVLEDTEKADVAFVMLFSGLGLTSLAVALVCNTISGLTLVLARIRKKPCNRRSAKSHDIEMVVQLVGIMVTSCICWSPLLIVGLITVKQSYEGSVGDDLATYKTLMIMGVRIASWNQILDPWVYILLRRSILQKIYLITKRQTDFKESTFRCWEIHSFPSSEKNPVSRV
ncbi:prostaglandin E receptor 1a (subtype EP1) isoform X2 [Megalobrama amblycephala]|uniref:prostaglandin E receptor 1a (subtype EP1) isoform X2 n=1 Tax=Megalobrama amblycephala TaxID=75352 RepID=UPI0020147C4C|nr:prostaglandin E receptor 1a (subtype EP1) isoform X2 [Megalobrama amblycephala]